MADDLTANAQFGPTNPHSRDWAAKPLVKATDRTLGVCHGSAHRSFIINFHAEPRVSKDKLGDGARPTMADVARGLGVAKITVSLALSNHSTVKESTRALICETAERMGYRLNVSARNLRQQRTRTIAVVIEMTPSHDRLMSEPYRCCCWAASCSS